jgi:two-component system, sensor histidine kinase and response regulator
MVAGDDGTHLVPPAQLDRSSVRVVVDNHRSDLILVVDDDKAKRAALKAALSPLGLSIVEADSGVAALRILMDQQFAVILLDVFMPAMSGFETAAFIRQRQQSEMTPIIFITAYGSDEIADTDRFAEGAVDFIFAPVDPAELRAKVTYFVNLFMKAEQLANRTLELEMSADHLRLLTDVAPIGIFQTDSDNRYVYTNPRWSALTGIAAETATGRQLDTVIATELRSDLMRQLSDPQVHRKEFSYRFEIPRAHTDPLVALMTAVAIPSDGGGIAGWIGTIADVTAEAGAETAMAKARDVANAASQIKSDFLANMSHEIRTPMNGVIGMADLLLDSHLDARQRDYAQIVRDSGEALLAIISDILDFSKVEAGMLSVDSLDFDLRGVLHDVVDLLAGSAQTKDIELVAIVDRHVPELLRGDAGRLRQVLLNLVGNAIKFTDSGDVSVRVALDRTGSVLRFDVRDTGDGIASDKIGVIFQPFVQLDTSTTRRYGGTGLGLAISGQLISLMGGDYGVSSTPGEGSDFWFTLPAPPNISNASTETPMVRDELHGLTALVVDDSISQRSLLVELLSEWGMIVTAVDSGNEAVSTLRRAADQGTPVALALLDLSMPEMEGYGLKLSIDALGISTALVLMVGMGQGVELDKAETLGFRSALSKPLHRSNLLRCVRSALGLPLAVPSLEQEVRAPETLDIAHRGRILLVEDNMINQKVALAMLSGTGYQIDAVTDGAAAVEAFALERYDAILMDCQMPGMNGYQATAAIRESEGPGRHTPIIALTAGARSEDRTRCLSGGMDGYLVKPVDKKVLLDLLATSIGVGPESSTPPRGSHAPTDRFVGSTVESQGGDPGSRPSDSASPSNGIGVVSNSRPALNSEILDQLHLLSESAGDDFVFDLFDLFVSDAGSQMDLLRQGFADADARLVAQSAHSLAGTSGNVGAAQLAGLCAKLSADCAEAGVLGDGAALGVIEMEFARVRSAIDLRRPSNR